MTHVDDNFSVFLSETKRLANGRYKRWLNTITVYLISSDNAKVRELISTINHRADDLFTIKILLIKLRDLVILHNVKIDKEFVLYYIDIVNTLRDKNMCIDLIKLINKNK